MSTSESASGAQPSRDTPETQQLPALTRPVIYIDSTGHERAAFISELNDPGQQDVELFVLDRIRGAYFQRHVPFNVSMARNTWTWPPRTD